MRFVIYSSERVYYRDSIELNDSEVLELAEFVAKEEERKVEDILEELKTEEGRVRICFQYWYDCFFELMDFEVDSSDNFEVDEVYSKDKDQD